MRGLAIGLPSARVAKDSRPRSIPVSCPVSGRGWHGTSALENATYQPSASRLIVTVLGVPSRGRGTGPVDADAPNLRQGEEAIIQPGAIAVFLEGEAVQAVAALEAREARLLTALYPAEERLIGLVEPRQHVLEEVRLEGGVLWHLRADGLQLCFLLA